MYTGNVLTPFKAPESAIVEQKRLRTFTSQWLTQSVSVAGAEEGAHTHRGIDAARLLLVISSICSHSLTNCTLL